jgi:hypothetical protein
MINPFIKNKEFTLKVITVVDSSVMSKDSRIVRTSTEYLVEKQEKITIYKVGNNLQYTAFIFNLNKPARDIYLYMQCNLGMNRDTIVLAQEKVCEVTGIGRNQFYDGISDLKDNGIICNLKKNEYWINPFILFRGDRISYYQENCPECIENVHNTYKKEGRYEEKEAENE